MYALRSLVLATDRRVHSPSPGHVTPQHPYLREDLCEKIQISIGQDCHEMWVKQERKKNAAAAADKDKKKRSATAAARAVVEAAKLHSAPPRK